MIAAVVALLGWIPSASASRVAGCVEDHQAGRQVGEPVLHASLARRILTETGATISFELIPCTRVDNMVAWAAKEGVPGIRPGRYVVYNPTWVRQVLGRDEDPQLVAVAHELGHLHNGDLAYHDTPDKEKERNADHFAGCAAARQGIAWEVVEDVFERIRNEQDDAYPTVKESLDAAGAGFAQCGGGTPGSSWPPEALWGLLGLAAVGVLGAGYAATRRAAPLPPPSAGNPTPSGGVTFGDGAVVQGSIVAGRDAVVHVLGGGGSPPLPAQGAPVATSLNPRPKHLQGLLLALFPSNQEIVQAFSTLEGAAGFLDNLPAVQVPRAQFVYELERQLKAHGLKQVAYNHLTQLRPQLRADILAVQERDP